MKSLSSFLRATFVGGVFFLLPIILLYTFIDRAHSITVKLLSPFAHLLPESWFGFPAAKLVAAIALILFCFLCGLMFRLSILKKSIGYFEKKFFSHIPGYNLLKSKAKDTLGEKINYYISTVLVKDGEFWRVGLLIEEGEDLCTVFFPMAPKNDSGEVFIVPSSLIKKVNVPTQEALSLMKTFGKGTQPWTRTS